MNIEDTLFHLASKKFGKNTQQLKAEDDFFETLSINSIQALELLTELENHFQIEIPDYELQDVRTFQGLANVIRRRIGS